MTYRLQCPGCKKMSDDIILDRYPVGWFVAKLYFMGGGRSISACSADCITAAREDAKKHYTERLAGFLQRIDEVKFEKFA